VAIATIFAERDEAGFYGESGEDFLRLSEIEGRFAPVHGGPSLAIIAAALHQRLPTLGSRLHSSVPRLRVR
jgi:hypothetical protein